MRAPRRSGGAGSWSRLPHLRAQQAEDAADRAGERLLVLLRAGEDVAALQGGQDRAGQLVGGEGVVELAEPLAGPDDVGERVPDPAEGVVDGAAEVVVGDDLRVLGQAADAAAAEHLAVAEEEPLDPLVEEEP